jgi:3-phosphoshikimate 1-carboxyvinyltransferase
VAGFLKLHDDDSCEVGPLKGWPSGDGHLELPICADKSMTHRALIFASIASGRSVIGRPLNSDDCLATKKAFCQLGVSIKDVLSADGALSWVVESGGIEAWRSPHEPIDVGNSGTAARLLTGLFSGVSGLKVRLTGDQSMRGRPMGRVIEPLRAMGAIIESSEGGKDGSCLPLTITGSILQPRSLTLSTPSAQVKSALLLAGLRSAGQSQIELPAGTRDHTEKMLAYFGANISSRTYLGRQIVQITGPWKPTPINCVIPSDPSSVAFFAAMAALHPGLKLVAHGVLTNKTRRGFFDVLKTMGVHVDWSNDPETDRGLGEETATLTVYRDPDTNLIPIRLSAQQTRLMIDEIPILAVVCGLVSGTSKLEGLSELRVKESDRLLETQDLLTKAGVPCDVLGDSLEIHGGRRILGRGLRAFSFSSQDHRLVMSAVVLATKAGQPSRIHGLKWISTSFPLFLPIFQNIKT